MKTETNRLAVDICDRCGKWAGAHATLPGQSNEHLCKCSNPLAVHAPLKVLTDAEIDKVFMQHAGINDCGVPYLRTYQEGFRHIARAVLSAAVVKPASAPLTDAQIAAVKNNIRPCPVPGVTAAWLDEFVRAVERHHGIGAATN